MLGSLCGQPELLDGFRAPRVHLNKHLAGGVLQPVWLLGDSGVNTTQKGTTKESPGSGLGLELVFRGSGTSKLVSMHPDCSLWVDYGQIFMGGAPLGLICILGRAFDIPWSGVVNLPGGTVDDINPA